MLSFVFPSVGILSRIDVPVCTQRSLELLWNGCVNVLSKLSSWFPAMTTLYRCGSCAVWHTDSIVFHCSYKFQPFLLPIQLLNSWTSSILPHFVKSPACINMSPSGTSNLMWGVKLWVSATIKRMFQWAFLWWFTEYGSLLPDIQTIRTLLSGTSAFGGFIAIFMTRWVFSVLIAFHAAVGSADRRCTSTGIDLIWPVKHQF